MSKNFIMKALSEAGVDYNKANDISEKVTILKTR